jgi:Holliday junction resolvase
VKFVPNNRYQRGARAERELLHIFHDKGWSVIRSSGSGVNALSPDVIFLKNREAICVECKAWDRGSLSLDPEQFTKLLEWERTALFPTFIGWRMNGLGWYFIKLDEMKKTKKSYTVTKKNAISIGRKLENIVSFNP